MLIPEVIKGVMSPAPTVPQGTEDAQKAEVILENLQKNGTFFYVPDDTPEIPSKNDEPVEFVEELGTRTATDGASRIAGEGVVTLIEEAFSGPEVASDNLEAAEKAQNILENYQTAGTIFSPTDGTPTVVPSITPAVPLPSIQMPGQTGESTDTTTDIDTTTDTDIDLDDSFGDGIA